jgi:hypothetical protein
MFAVVAAGGERARRRPLMIELPRGLRRLPLVRTGNVPEVDGKSGRGEAAVARRRQRIVTSLRRPVIAVERS